LSIHPSSTHRKISARALNQASARFFGWEWKRAASPTTSTTAAAAAAASGFEDLVARVEANHEHLL
jgi:hypothetical protein